jgi:hypothetical protein
MLQIYSGECCLCDVGIPVGFNDYTGMPLHTGDIVLIYYVNYPDTDMESWDDSGMTAVVSNQYQSLSDGSIKANNDVKPFVMGIKDCGFDSPEWRIKILKSHEDVISGENWKSYGFNYRESVSVPHEPSKSDEQEKV